MAASDQASVVVRTRDAWRWRTIRALRTLPMLPTFIILLTAVVATFGDFIVGSVDQLHPPTEVHLQVPKQAPSSEYLLGTDKLGRDVLSRTIKATQQSMMVAAVSILFGAIVGTVLGLLAGFRGGWVDALMMRVVDAALAFPAILIALVFVVTVGPGFWPVVIIMVLILWAPFARLVRAQTLSWKERDFVALARVAGCSSPRIIGVHIFPNVVDSLVVLMTLQVGWVMTIEGTLSFLGAGIPPPSPTWGGMVASGREFIRTAWWISIFPGLAIFIVVLSFNLFGDWLRDTLDPKLRQL